ncbi:hypothetical protein [Hafnia alvei]|uniref:hypothetical protein n=1 Tax=Hafnia alvei TaxID=569 RepID=UPI00345CC1E6
MKYPDGSDVLLGDIVTLGGGINGVVVCNFENNEFAKGFDKDEWGDFNVGIMVESPQAGLVYYSGDCIDLTLVNRFASHSSHKKRRARSYK